MTGLAQLDEQAVRDFVGPGTDPTLLEALARFQVRKRLLQLVFVTRRVERDAPELYARTGLAPAYEMLRQAPPEDVEAVAGYPSFGRWCAVAARMVEHEMHINLADGQVASHLARLGSFAIVAAARSRDAELELRFGADGTFCLPTLRLVVDGGLALAGARARCTLGADGTVTVAGPGPTQVRRLPALPGVDGDLELNDADSLLRAGFGDEEFERVSARGIERWSAVVAAAGDELRALLPQGAAEVGRFVRVLVPLVNRTPGVHRSAASADAFGMVQMSWSKRPRQLAEALLHEYYHTKLNTLLDLDPVFVDDDGAEAYYSPWRDDPRPLRGVLHGAFSFYIVTRFWQQTANGANHAGAGRQFRREAARRHRQVCLALAELRAHAKLTAIGTVLVDELQARVESCGAGVGVDPATRHELDRQLAAHQTDWHARRQAHDGELAQRVAQLDALWTAAGGSTGTIATTDSAVPANARSLVVWSALGIDQPLTANRVADRLPRRDLSFDMLGRLSVVAPDRYQEIVATLAADDSDDLLAQLLNGHVAYITGDYQQAARRYGRCLQAVPANLDAWRDFAFTVRHLGLRRECDAFLFWSDLVASFAEGHVLDRDTFGRLGVTEPDGYGGQPWLPQLLLLRWIGREAR